MKNRFNHLLTVLCLSSFITAAHAGERAAAVDSLSLEGRWDITIMMAGQKKPAWLEVRHSGYHTLVGHFVGVSGSARPVSKINVSGNKFNFTIPPQWERGS